MVKHTLTICRQIVDELFECVWPFCETDAKKVKDYKALSSEDSEGGLRATFCKNYTDLV